MSRSFDAARARAIDRGMGFIEGLSRRRGGLEQFGSALLYCCSFMAATARDPELQSRARAVTVDAFRAWMDQRREGLYDGSAESVTTAVQTFDAVSRIGFHYPEVKKALRKLVLDHEVSEYYNFDPRVEAPPSDVPEACACMTFNVRGTRRCAECKAKLEMVPAMRVWYLSFTSAYCGARYGAPLRMPYEEVMEWLPQMRRYRSPKQGDVAFHDSVYCITHIVYTLNDYGRFLLSPYWLPEEYSFLATHWATPIENNNPDMAGEFIDSLRAFGLSTEEPAIRYAMEYLIESQNEDGSWGVKEGKIDYRRFHATWAAMDGLRDFNWEREGLSFPKMLPKLQRWAEAR